MHTGSRNPCAFLSAAKSIPYQYWCGISIAIYETAHMRRSSHDVPNYYQMMLGGLRFWSADWNFISLVTSILVHKNIKCENPLSSLKYNILVAKLVGFVEIFIFCHFVWAFSLSNERRGHCVFWWHVRKRIDHWFSVTTGKCQPSGPPLQWETLQALFPTGALDPQVGIFLSPLNIKHQ